MTTSKPSKALRLVSWNVNGVRACLAKGMQQTIASLNPDILCLQEIKADAAIMSELVTQNFPNYLLFNSSALKKGYSGVATLVKKDSSLLLEESSSTISKSSNSALALKNSNPDIKFFADEGRFSIIKTNLFLLLNLYIPSGTSGESRQDLKYVFLDHLLNYLKHAQTEALPIIICGDFNICHKPIDIHHPKQAEKQKLTGFLPQERAWIDQLISLGFVDCFRIYAGEIEKVYSWWSYRAAARSKNLGWRIDYFFCSKALAHRLECAQIHSEMVGSDHCPVSVEFNFN